MFYELELQDHIRIPPTDFESSDLKSIILKNLNEKFENFISKEDGIAIAVSDIKNIGEGVIIPGDGAAFYETTFNLLVFRPEIHELILGDITEITDFGVFFNMGAIDGMIHLSQTMDDYVSLSKVGVLTGKESKRVLKPGERCRSRIIAVSYKELNNPKIGLTMRQPSLGSLAWIKEDKEKAQAADKGDKK
ncbi:MAG: DNA-directed RNA polymerase [Nanoarchaeota archaeon]|jgi:DNA-directed RNA polymerase subunit E'|nr:DNA-directed RNA polymerase [Nanoarchaeota archaeon]|tara:strand:- start:10254 stop:10826 length:573 start_codon:yes stop_codon:yes gene_type:complete